MMDLTGLTIDAARSFVAGGKTSALALAEAFYAKIESDDPKIGAYLILSKERALEKAAEIDRLAKSGSGLPPLAGVPVGIKDVMVTKGVRTTAGSKILGNYIPPYDCYGSGEARSCWRGRAWQDSIATSLLWDRRMRIRRSSRCIIRAISAECPADRRADRRRQLLRHGSRHFGIRYRRLDSSAGIVLRCSGIEADLRACVALWPDRVCVVARSHRPVGKTVKDAAMMLQHDCRTRSNGFDFC